MHIVSIFLVHLYGDGSKDCQRWKLSWWETSISACFVLSSSCRAWDFDFFFSDKNQPYSTILTSQPPLHHITSTCFPWSWSCKCIVYFRQWRWTNQLFHTDVFSHFRNHHICPLWKTTMKNAIGIYVVLFFFYKRTLTPWPPWPHFTEVEPRQELPAWAQPPDRPPPHATPNGRQVPLVRVGMRHQQGMCIIDHIDF